MRSSAPRVLFICGSLNQTTMMHEIAGNLEGVEPSFTPFYCDGFLHWLTRHGWLDFTILGGQMRRHTDDYLARHRLPLDERGDQGPYDLIVTCTDLIVQRNIRGRPVVLVQEGMTDPENLGYQLVKTLGLPRWVASTAATGLSLAYAKFCVASEGYRDLFISKGVPRDRLVVTGIPNFDNCRAYRDNEFPHSGYVLVATSDTRETFKRDDRRAFFHHVKEVADGREVIVKLHPNENARRSIREIRRVLPDATIYVDGNVHHMIANCDVLITQWSSVTYVGLALGKECHSYFDLQELSRLLPMQNGGASARNIAAVCRQVLDESAGTMAPELRAAS